MIFKIINHLERETKHTHPHPHPQNLQWIDLKYIADREAEYKIQALSTIKDFKDWMSDYLAKTDSIDIACSSIEGIVLRYYAANSIGAY